MGATFKNERRFVVGVFNGKFLKSTGNQYDAMLELAKQKSVTQPGGASGPRFNPSYGFFAIAIMLFAIAGTRPTRSKRETSSPASLSSIPSVRIDQNLM